MPISTRFLLLLALVLSLGTLAGCSTATTEKREAITPKAHEHQVLREDESSDFLQDGWTRAEQDVATYISSAVIYFYFDSFALTPESQAVLREKADRIKAFPGLIVVIGGHCDARGTEEYNIALGERRAKAAYDYLVQLGVPSRQLEIISYGKLHPAVQGTGEYVWAKNRRDEFKVTKKTR